MTRFPRTFLSRRGCSRILICAALLFITGVTAGSATVEGVVSDSFGHPIAETKVNIANPYGAGEGVIRYVTTDSNGRFSMNNVKAGKYNVYAQKPSIGYGDPEFVFYSVGRPPSPQVDIKAGDKSVNVIVNLGEPGGILKASVVDEETGEPVTTGKMQALPHARHQYVHFIVRWSGRGYRHSGSTVAVGHGRYGSGL
jgi:hypothetical protein